MADKKSPTLVKTIAPLPIPKRSYGLHVSTSAKGNLGFPFLAYSCGRDVIFRNLEDLSQSRIFTEHKAKVNVVRVSPSGLWAASGDEEGNVLVWECGASTWGKVKTSASCCSSVNDLDWSPDGKQVVAVGGGEGDRGRVFTYDSGNNVGKIEMHSKPILACSYKQVRPFAIATCAEDMVVNFYTGPPFKHIKGHNDSHIRYPNCVRFSPDGSQFISVGSDSRVVVYDGKTGERLRNIENKKDGHSGSIYSFSYSPDGKQILTASADKTVKLWDVESGDVVKTFQISAKSGVPDMQVATFWQLVGEKNYVGTVSLSGAINFFDLDKTDAPSQIVQGVSAQAQALLVDRKGGHFYVSTNDGQVSQFDFASGLAKWFSGKGHEKNINGLALSGENLVTIGYDDKLRLSKISSLEFSTEALVLGGQPNAVATGQQDNSLIAVTLTKGRLLFIKGGDIKNTVELSFEPTSVAWSADDSEVVVGGKDKKSHFFAFDGSKFTAGRVLADFDKPVLAVHYRPNSDMVSSVSADKGLYFHQGEKNLNPTGWIYHSASVTASAWSPSGARFASGSADENVILWHDFTAFKDENRVLLKDAHSQGVDFLAFWDEDTLISVGGDRTTRIWTLPSL